MRGAYGLQISLQWAAHAACQRSVAAPAHWALQVQAVSSQQTLHAGEARWALQVQAVPSQRTLHAGDLPETVAVCQC